MSLHGWLRTAIAGAALAALFASPGYAQNAAPPHHIRGTIESLQDHTLTVKTRRGPTDKLSLADNVKVIMVSRANISDIKDGEFVGIASVEKHGMSEALEVVVFEEKLRGLAEGHYPWDLGSRPNMMTNANIAQVKAVRGGDELKLDYKGGTQTITVPPNATVVLATESSPEALKPGAKVFVVATGASGGEVAQAVIVGKNGLRPPM